MADGRWQMAGRDGRVCVGSICELQMADADADADENISLQFCGVITNYQNSF